MVVGAVGTGCCTDAQTGWWCCAGPTEGAASLAFFDWRYCQHAADNSRGCCGCAAGPDRGCMAARSVCGWGDGGGGGEASRRQLRRTAPAAAVAAVAPHRTAVSKKQGTLAACPSPIDQQCVQCITAAAAASAACCCWLCVALPAASEPAAAAACAGSRLPCCCIGPHK